MTAVTAVLPTVWHPSSSHSDYCHLQPPSAYNAVGRFFAPDFMAPALSVTARWAQIGATMCSIAAIYRPHPDDRPVIYSMNRSLSHRGPTDSGFYVDETVCLMHNRLAVMDPLNGQQPMSVVYNDRQFTVIYNGE